MAQGPLLARLLTRVLVNGRLRRLLTAAAAFSASPIAAENGAPTTAAPDGGCGCFRVILGAIVLLGEILLLGELLIFCARGVLLTLDAILLNLGRLHMLGPSEIRVFKLAALDFLSHQTTICEQLDGNSTIHVNLLDRQARDDEGCHNGDDAARSFDHG